MDWEVLIKAIISTALRVLGFIGIVALAYILGILYRYEIISFLSEWAGPTLLVISTIALLVAQTWSMYRRKLVEKMRYKDKSGSGLM